MTEDVSMQIHLAVTVCLLAALVSTVCTLLVVGMNWQNSYTTNMIITTTNIQSQILREICMEQKVSAPTAYKALKTNEGAISMISIRYLDGTHTSNLDNLLKHAEIYVHVELFLDPSDGLYMVTVVEVE